MSLNLRQIEVFRAVMITGSISGAARLLSVSQPAISRLLAYTEGRLGLKLFERVKGRLHPTPEAKRLFVEVDQVYQGVQRVNEVAQDLLQRSTGTLRIVSSPSVGQGLIPSTIAAFRHQHGDVRIKFEVMTINDLVRQVAGNQADLGVVNLPVDHPNVITTPLSEGRLVCICPKDHRLAQLSTIKAADLVPYPLISYGRETPYGMIVNRFLARAAQEAKVGIEVRFSQVACSLVQAGAGVAIIDEFALMGRTWPDIVARRVSPRTMMRVSLVNSRYEPLSRVALAFVDILNDLLAARSNRKRDRDSQ